MEYARALGQWDMGQDLGHSYADNIIITKRLEHLCARWDSGTWDKIWDKGTQ